MKKIKIVQALNITTFVLKANGTFVAKVSEIYLKILKFGPPCTQCRVKAYAQYARA